MLLIKKKEFKFDLKILIIGNDIRKKFIKIKKN